MHAYIAYRKQYTSEQSQICYLPSMYTHALKSQSSFAGKCGGAARSPMVHDDTISANANMPGST